MINTITHQQRELVKKSFAIIEPNALQAANVFYNRLFEIAPEVKPMFQSDMKDQGRKLMAMLSTAIHSIDNLNLLIPAVKKLGKRHTSYGVQDTHYALVASALIYTLQVGLGEEWDEELEQAWVSVYNTLAEVMQNAGREPVYA